MPYMRLLEFWSLLARRPLNSLHLFISLKQKQILDFSSFNTGTAFQHIYFSCCWDFFWEISKNRSEFSLHIVGGLEKLQLHQVKFSSSLFIPWVSHWLCREIKSWSTNHTQPSSGALPGPTKCTRNTHQCWHSSDTSSHSELALCHSASAWNVCQGLHLTDGRVLAGSLTVAKLSAGECLFFQF